MSEVNVTQNRESRRFGRILFKTQALLAGALILGSACSADEGLESSQTVLGPGARETAVCGYGTHLGEDGVRIARIDLPGGEHVKLYDPNHQAKSIRESYRSMARGEANPVVELFLSMRRTGQYLLELNEDSQLTDAHLTRELSQDQVNAACYPSIQ